MGWKNVSFGVNMRACGGWKQCGMHRVQPPGWSSNPAFKKPPENPAAKGMKGRRGVVGHRTRDRDRQRRQDAERPEETHRCVALLADVRLCTTHEQASSRGPLVGGEPPGGGGCGGVGGHQRHLFGTTAWSAREESPAGGGL